MSTTKKLSIAIPTYNRSKLLIQTIENLTKQHEFQDIEIVICNNASTDDTHIKIQPYLHLYKNIKYILNEQTISLDENMLKVAQNVNSEYFLFLGDDDMLISQGIAEILNFLQFNHYDYILLSALNVSEDMSKYFGKTLNLNQNKTYTSPITFFKEHWKNMPFGTLLVNTENFNIGLHDSQKFLGTSHAYSGVIFEYLALKYLKIGQVQILVYANPLVLLRTVKKTWNKTETRIKYYEIPLWFSHIHPLYKEVSTPILKQILNHEFKFKSLFKQRRKAQLNIQTFQQNTIYATFLQKIKYILISLIPMIKKKIA